MICEDGEVVSSTSFKFKSEDVHLASSQWLFALRICLSKMRTELFNSQRLKEVNICGISISGNGPTLVTNRGFTLLWNDDAYFSEKFNYSEEIQNQIDESIFISRILILKNHFSEEFEKAKYIFSGPEYFIYQLTDNPVTVLPEKRFLSAYWNDNLLNQLEIPSEKLPKFIEIGEKCGDLTKSIFDFLELDDFVDDSNKQIPIFATGPDFIAALIGTNTLYAGKICNRCGSSEGYNYCVPAPVDEYGVRVLPSVIPGLWNISILDPKSSTHTQEDRILDGMVAINKLKRIATKYNFPFPTKIVVSGGQTNAPGFMKRKSEAMKMKFSLTSNKHAELVGDACVGWFGLNKFDSLISAADLIVREKNI